MSDFLNLKGAKDLNTDAIHLSAVANSKNPVTGAPIYTHVNRAGGVDYTLQGFWNSLGPVVMPWTSVAGGTLTQPNQAFLHPANGNYYSWTGAYPAGGYVVAPGTDPKLDTGYVVRSAEGLRGELAGSGGADLIGESTGGTMQDAINAINGRYAYAGKSIVDLLSKSELAQLLSNDNTLDLTDKIQSLIDEKKPFYLLPNVRHYCDGSLQMKSGAKILAAGDGTNQQQGNAWTVETAIVFNQATTSIGIQLSSASGWVTEWAIDGVTLDTIDNTASVGSFTMLDVDSTHNGCYNFKLHCYVRGAKFGLDVDSHFWNGDLDIRFAYCYKPFVRSANGYSTSLSGWIKTTFCFHGVEIHQARYCQLNLWFDQCGKNAPAFVIGAAPSNELPVLLKVSNSVGLSGTMGVEKSNAQWINATSYSSLKYVTHYFSTPSDVFLIDATRTANIPISKQSLVYANNSQIAINGMIVSHLTANGYPAASTSSTTYFAIPDGSDEPRLIFDGCFLNMQEYCVCPAGTEKFISAQTDRNGSFRFGATSVNVPRQSIDWVDDLLRFGTKLDQSFHQIKRSVPFVDGEKCLEIGGAAFAANVEFRAVNGGAANTAVAAIRIPASSSTSRSINAGGTINTSGADYAEYMVKSSGCGEIAKGAICGVTMDGLLTDVFDNAVSFVVKSTDPAYVGGDNWGQLEEPADRDSHEWSLWASSLESMRHRVDRIAFCGQVPCNVYGAQPGEYIIPVRSEDGKIAGAAISNPDFADYRNAVGVVWRVLDDGRAWIAVKIA